MFGSDGAGTKFALKGFFSCAIGGAAAAAAGRGCWTECFVVAGPSPVLFAEDDAGGSGSIDLAAAGLEPRGLCRGATDVLPPVLGGSDCGCWGDITGVPGARTCRVPVRAAVRIFRELGKHYSLFRSASF